MSDWIKELDSSETPSNGGRVRRRGWRTQFVRADITNGRAMACWKKRSS